MTLAEITSLLGGVGLFLFGMTMMSTGLKNSCGDNLQNILEKATANKYIAVIVGIVMTMLIQSSSATDVMVIGFVNSSLMTLAQAIGVIMGANIGTTITAQITAFNIHTFTPFLLFCGAIMYLFMKKNIVKNVGSVIMGFGMLFEGVAIMKVAILPLSQTQVFIDFMETLSNPAVALIFGVAFTAVMQSSSSSIVIFQAFCIQELISYDVCIYLVIGAAIGSVTPNILASLTANRNGKRTACINLIFNVIRAIIIVIVINIFPQTLEFIKSLSPNDVGRQIANSHTIFAIFAVLVELPFTKYIIDLSYKIVPIEESEARAEEERSLKFMSQIDKIPTNMAINQAKLEANRMGHFALENFSDAMDCFFDYTEDKAERVFELEETVDILNRDIADCMVQLRASDLSNENLKRVTAVSTAVNDMERISDHAENIVEYTQRMKAQKTKFSKKALKELKELSDNVSESINMALDIFLNENYSRLDEIEKLEAKIDKQSKKYINNHIERLMKEDCGPLAGILFSDIVTDLERCGDHAINIAYAFTNKA